MKRRGVNCELITEFAKDLTWEHNKSALKCQPYIFGNQYYRFARCQGEVDVLITDSPLLQSLLYNLDQQTNAFRELVVERFHDFENFNFVIERNCEYSEVGRNESYEEACGYDEAIRKLLQELHEPYTVLEKGRNEMQTDILCEISDAMMERTFHDGMLERVLPEA